MSARSPEELDRLFMDALNAGNLDALTALYEPHATLAAQPGRMVRGQAAVRETLARILASKPKISLTNKIVGQTGDIALSTARWRLTRLSPAGERVEATGDSVEVARRQPDGTWLFVIDSPWGLEWDQTA